jgi:phosphate transport system substrate-binding protein
MRKLTTTVALAVAGAAALAAPMSATAAAKKTTITISGSTSVAPLAGLLIKEYLKGPGKGKTAFRLAQGGSDVGIADVSRGRVTIGMSSRDPKTSDPKGVNFLKIARDPLCLVVNSGNSLANLTQPQVQAIFTGRVRDWADVPGTNRTGTINMYVRTAASGSQDAFQSIFLGSATTSSAASAQTSSGLLVAAIQNDPNGVGYVSYEFAAKLKTIGYNGVACTLQNAKSGEYGGTRNFWMVTRGAAQGETKKFLKWITTNAKARKIVSTLWVPLS